ncbi:hypothetical protein WMY93_030450 [Mugilogobius chulae]|uniref:Uncharacterized protein n=1 Tax=Mugilogobius chulae TaxID=88201 RepID=A0AAW0MKA7_9GOBI
MSMVPESWCVGCLQCCRADVIYALCFVREAALKQALFTLSAPLGGRSVPSSPPSAFHQVVCSQSCQCQTSKLNEDFLTALHFHDDRAGCWLGDEERDGGRHQENQSGPEDHEVDDSSEKTPSKASKSPQKTTKRPKTVPVKVTLLDGSDYDTAVELGVLTLSQILAAHNSSLAAVSVALSPCSQVSSSN